MPQDGGLRPETARAVNAVVARTQARGRVPSLVAAVVRGGGVAHLAAAGAPVGRSHQFRIGSITKTMTAAMVMQLRDAGQLGLDDPLQTYRVRRSAT